MAKVDTTGGDQATDPLSLVLHELGNVLNALSLHVQALAAAELGVPQRGHVQAAHRLARKSATLLGEVRRLREPGASRGPARLTPNRNPR